MAIPVLKQLLFSTHKHIPISSLSFSSSSSQPSDQSANLISTVVSILIQQRSKSRWGNLQTLYPNGFHPNEFSQIALQLKNNPHLALRFFLWTQHKSLCHHNLLTYSTTIHILTRARLLTQAHSLIRTAIRIPQQSTNNNDNLVPKPLKLFQSLVMTYRLCGSAPFVFDLLVKACLEIKKIDSAIEIVRMLRSRGISPKVGTLNDLVYWVLKVRGGCVGYEVYREVFGLEGDGVVGNVKRVYKVWPNVHTFNVLMGGFYQDGMVEKVEMIWNEMVGFDCVPNCYSYSILMAVYCEEGRMGEAEKLWEEMRVKEVEADVVSYNTMIGGFCKIGEVEKAEELYREMGLNGVESSCATYEHLVNGYCNVGDVDSALLVYKDMCRKGFRPEALTLDVVIGGLCVKRRVYEAVEILTGGVKDFGLVPKGKSYETLLKGLCEEGRMEEALKIQAEMVGKGFEPNLEIYGAFIEGYVRQGNEEMVEVLRNEVLEKQMRGKREVDDVCLL